MKKDDSGKIIWEVGDRCRVFDVRLYVDDEITQPDYTFRPATIIRLYKSFGEDLADICFDKEDISRAHYVWGIRELI